MTRQHDEDESAAQTTSPRQADYGSNTGRASSSGTRPRTGDMRGASVDVKVTRIFTTAVLGPGDGTVAL